MGEAGGKYRVNRWHKEPVHAQAHYHHRQPFGLYYVITQRFGRYLSHVENARTAYLRFALGHCHVWHCPPRSPKWSSRTRVLQPWGATSVHCSDRAQETVPRTDKKVERALHFVVPLLASLSYSRCRVESGTELYANYKGKTRKLWCSNCRVGP